jgi:hypothetical protein
MPKNASMESSKTDEAPVRRGLTPSAAPEDAEIEATAAPEDRRNVFERLFDYEKNRTAPAGETEEEPGEEQEGQPSGNKWARLRKRAQEAEKEVQRVNFQTQQERQQIQQQFGQMQNYVSELKAENAAIKARFEEAQKYQSQTNKSSDPDYVGEFENRILSKAKEQFQPLLEERAKEVETLRNELQREKMATQQREDAMRVTEQTLEMVNDHVLPEYRNMLPEDLELRLSMTTLGMLQGVPGLTHAEVGPMLRRTILEAASLIEKYHNTNSKTKTANKAAAPRATPQGRGAVGRPSKGVSLEEWMSGISPIQKDYESGLL